MSFQLSMFKSGKTCYYLTIYGQFTIFTYLLSIFILMRLFLKSFVSKRALRNTWKLKNLKARLEAAQNKCIRFSLKLGDRKSITVKEFEEINWLPIHERFNQCILSCLYKFHAKKAPDYMDETFYHAKCNEIHTRYSYQKLKLPHRKTNQGLRALSYIGSLIVE